MGGMTVSRDWRIPLYFTFFFWLYYILFTVFPYSLPESISRDIWFGALGQVKDG